MIRVLCVTVDSNLMSGVTQAFPELKFEITHVSSLAAEVSPTATLWAVLILDLDTVAEETITGEYLKKVMQHSKRTVALVSSRRDATRTLLNETDAIVLHSPTTTGEIVLVLNRILRPRSSPENSCRSSSGATL